MKSPVGFASKLMKYVIVDDIVVSVRSDPYETAKQIVEIDSNNLKISKFY